MVGSFDYYSDLLIDTVDNLFGLPITFIASDSRFPDVIASGMVDNRVIKTDDYGNKVIEENKRITVADSLIPSYIEIGDSIKVNEENKTYVILDIEPDVNSSKVFYLSE